MTSPRLLVVTGGHPYERAPFVEAFQSIAPSRWTHAEHPHAQPLLNPEGCTDVDVVVFYDIPGLRFTRADPPTETPFPGPDVIAGFEALLEAGKGLVFLHHAIAGWPAWHRYAEIVGGRFHYQPGVLDGTAYPDSGYRFDVTHHVEVLDRTHPICDGLGDGFDLTDELYLFPVLTSEVVPLLRTTFPMDDPSLFFSADRAIRGHRNTNDGWSHPVGSNLVGWVKHADNAPVAYLQFGDGPQTYADPNFRRVLTNAIEWAASDDAHAWARARRSSELQS